MKLEKNNNKYMNVIEFENSSAFDVTICVNVSIKNWNNSEKKEKQTNLFEKLFR